MGRGHAGPVIRPGLGEIQRPVDEGMAMAGDVGGKHADLAVRDLARRAGVLSPDPARRPTLLEKAGLIDHQHRIRIGKGLDYVIAHHIAERIGLPLRPTQQSLLAPRPGIARGFRAHPARLAPLRTKQSIQKEPG
jgi:hypothetical protein